MHWGYCGHGRQTGIKPRRPATNLSFNTPNSTECCSVYHFSPWSWFEEKLLNNLMKHCKTQMLKTVASYGSLIKIICISHTEKFTEWLAVYTSMATKNKDVAEKHFLRTGMTFSESLMVSGVCQKCTKQAWYSLTPESKSIKSVIVMCFYHNTSCLQYVRPLAILSFNEI